MHIVTQAKSSAIAYEHPAARKKWMALFVQRQPDQHFGLFCASAALAAFGGTKENIIQFSNTRKGIFSIPFTSI